MMSALIRGMLSSCLFLLITGVMFAQGGTGRDSVRERIGLDSAQNSRKDIFTLHFDFDRSEIRRKDNLPVDFIISHQIDSIRIIGYTDKVGSTDYNLELSRRRAKAVEEALWEKYLHKWAIGKLRKPLIL